jgi:CheY-like chemotaxis protein
MDRSNESVTILLIDDDSSAIEAIRPALEDEGYHVHHVAATPSAQTLADLHPDLLVIDLNAGSPGSNWQVVREIEDRSAHRRVPIIVYGGDGAFVAAGDVRTYSRATAVLARPVRLEVLLPVVSQALERRRQDWRMDVPHHEVSSLPESAWGW